MTLIAALIPLAYIKNRGWRRWSGGRPPPLVRLGHQPRHHRREQPLVSRSGHTHDEVERLGIGAYQHPGPVLADAVEDDLRRLLRRRVGELLVEGPRQLVLVEALDRRHVARDRG